NLLFWGSLYGLSAARRAARAAEVLARLDMSDRAGEPVWSLSRGLLQRAAIAKALLHDPAVLLLDEPFTGLDLAAAGQLRVLLGELHDGGRMMVLATHNVDEGAELATDVAFQRRRDRRSLPARHGRWLSCCGRRGRWRAKTCCSSSAPAPPSSRPSCSPPSCSRCSTSGGTPPRCRPSISPRRFSG